MLFFELSFADKSLNNGIILALPQMCFQAWQIGWMELNVL